MIIDDRFLCEAYLAELLLVLKSVPESSLFTKKSILDTVRKLVVLHPFVKTQFYSHWITGAVEVIRIAGTLDPIRQSLGPSKIAMHLRVVRSAVRFLNKALASYPPNRQIFLDVGIAKLMQAVESNGLMKMGGGLAFVGLLLEIAVDVDLLHEDSGATENASAAGNRPNRQARQSFDEAVEVAAFRDRLNSICHA